MTAKAAIKKHGQAAVDALFQEFLQLHDKTVFAGKHRSELTKAERQAALRAISIIKEKRCGKIKGRIVADGRPQRNLYTKDESSSPSCDVLMMSILIDAGSTGTLLQRMSQERIWTLTYMISLS
jgi:hypothetical protein